MPCLLLLALRLRLNNFGFTQTILGSSNYITNFVGEVSQHMEYFAFGETFIEEHKNSHNSPFKYNGKELDEESGLYYYGARYYDPRISIWASVDPLVEQTMDAFGYCFQNPIRLIDPTGMSPENLDNQDKKKKTESKKVNVAVHFGGHEPNKEAKDYNDANRKDFKDLDSNVIKIENVKNIDELKIELKKRVGNNKIANLFIASHGGNDYIALGEDFVSDNKTWNKAYPEMKENLSKLKDVLEPYLNNTKVMFTACYTGLGETINKSFVSLAKKTMSTFYFDGTAGTANVRRLNNPDDKPLNNPIFPNKGNNKFANRWNATYSNGEVRFTWRMYVTRKGNIKHSSLINR